MISISIIFALLASSVMSDVSVQYTEREFESKIANNKLAIVAFYAPWCHYSKALLPEFEHAAYVTNSILRMNVGMIKVDCYEKDATICARNKVHGYPTIKVFKNGVPFKVYPGPRTSEALVYFIMDIIHGIIKD